METKITLIGTLRELLPDHHLIFHIDKYFSVVNSIGRLKREEGLKYTVKKIKEHVYVWRIS